MRFPLSRVVFSVTLLAGPGPFATGRTLPEDVTVKAFLRPTAALKGPRLQVLMRVPLVALNDIQFPSRGSGYIDFSRVDQVLPGVARYWLANSLEVFEEGIRLPRPEVSEIRLSPFSDLSYRSFDEALAHTTGPRLTDSTDAFLTQLWFDVLFEYPIRSEHSAFSVNPRFARLGVRVATNLTFLGPGAPPREFEFSGDPELIRLEPRAWETATRFFHWGALHLFHGSDYLLFLVCAVLPFRRLRDALIPTAAFAVTSAIGFAGVVLGQVPDGFWFPPLIHTLIAALIVYSALENIAGIVPAGRRAVITLISGLFFGFDFAFGYLAKAQFAGAWHGFAAASFDAGTIACLTAVVVIVVPTLRLVLRFTPESRTEIIVLSVLAAHTAWHWMTERAAVFSRYPIRLPAMDAVFVATAMRWGVVFVLLAGAAWFAAGYLKPKGAEQQ